MLTINVEKVRHKNMKRICLRFPLDRELIALTRLLPDARWSHNLKAWHIPGSEENEHAIYELFKGKAHLIMEKSVNETLHKELNTEVREKIMKLKSWMRSRRYSESTINTYTEALTIFLRFNNTKALSEITNEDLITFNNDYILANNYSPSFQNQLVNAIKLLFAQVENRSLEISLIHRPKRAKVLPNVLSKEEVKAILEVPCNIKHKAMLSLIYSCGLRCGELLKLKPEHIDSNRKLLIIKNAKGKKDRITPLSLKIIGLLRDYYKGYKPKVYLFEGAKEGEPYTERSLQQVMKYCTQKAGIEKPVTLHWLRHSYATHLLENGTDLRYIQEILGHRSSKTTEIYTHVSTKNIQDIRSPFDFL